MEPCRLKWGWLSMDWGRFPGMGEQVSSTPIVFLKAHLYFVKHELWSTAGFGEKFQWGQKLAFHSWHGVAQAKLTSVPKRLRVWACVLQQVSMHKGSQTCLNLPKAKLQLRQDRRCNIMRQYTKQDPKYPIRSSRHCNFSHNLNSWLDLAFGMVSIVFETNLWKESWTLHKWN